MPNSHSSGENKGLDSTMPLHDFFRVQRQLQETFRRLEAPLGSFQLRFIEQLRHNEEAVKLLANPIGRLQSSLLGLADQQHHIKQVLTQNLLRFGEQQRHIEETFRHAFVRFAEQQRSIEKTFRKLAVQVSPTTSVFHRYVEEENRLRNLLNSTFTRIPFDSSIDNIAAVSLKLNAIFSDIRKELYEVTSNAQIRSGESSLPTQDAAVQIDEFISRSKVLSELASGQQELSKTIDLIYDEIKELKSPIKFNLFKILLSFLIGYFINLTTPYVGEIIHRHFNKGEIVRKIQSEANSLGLQDKDLRDLRIVVADALRVREVPSRRSRTIGILYQGEVVRQATKDRDWTLVEFSDGDVTFKGWAFTRYLKRIDVSSR